ncbi:MAG: DNA-protecting protein DprA [Clostridia bacterium]|nr:DNA-protecting protein DprA [Clostridia bacterium]
MAAAPSDDEARQAYWLALSKIEGVGGRRLRVLVGHFGSPEAAWRARADEIKGLPGWGDKVREAFLSQRARIDPAKEYRAARRAGIEIWTVEDERYPELLREIPDPPPVLFARGRPVPPDAVLLAIVGTRRASAYGRRVARELARAVTAAGMGVVSGLARGIDTEAHLGALEAGGFTVGVLGCGLDMVYPPENGRLYAAVAAHGLLLSEFPLGTRPRAGNFPARNRIISGLARGVVVVEAGERSGALITADLALEQGRDVFAVPGPVTSPCSRGSNSLIKQGAKLVDSAADILEEYGLVPPPRVAEHVSPAKLEPRERRILGLLGGTPVQLEELAELSGYNISELAQVLTLLELKGLVQQLPGKQFIARER